jgi:hypothetical protein
MRRIAGIKPSLDERRAATREHVRQYRERRRQGIVLRPRQEPKTVESMVAADRRRLEFYSSLGPRRRR